MQIQEPRESPYQNSWPQSSELDQTVQAVPKLQGQELETLHTVLLARRKSGEEFLSTHTIVLYSRDADLP